MEQSLRQNNHTPDKVEDKSFKWLLKSCVWVVGEETWPYGHMTKQEAGTALGALYFKPKLITMLGLLQRLDSHPAFWMTKTPLLLYNFQSNRQSNKQTPYKRIVLLSIPILYLFLGQPITINSSVIVCRYMNIACVYQNQFIHSCNWIQSERCSKLGDVIIARLVFCVLHVNQSSLTVEIYRYSITWHVK
jgi:hypothetical protein